MVDWKSPEEVGRDFQIFDKFLHALFGLLIWEYLTSLDFEWEFITGKRQFRWPMILYFLGRYIQMFAITGALVGLDSTSELQCQPLYRFIFFCGFISIMISSVTLALRTIALWANNLYIIAAVVLAASGQIALVVLITISTQGTWAPQTGCEIYGGETYTTALFIYTMCFNAAVLVLTIIKLVKMSANANSTQLLGHSKLAHIIFADGLIFFIIALLADLVVVVLVVLDFNPAMNVMFQVPSSIVSTIVACRSVRRLMNFSQGTTVVTFGNTNGSSSQTKGGRVIQSEQSMIRSSPEVHVQMETFTHTEDSFVKLHQSESITERDIEKKGRGSV
ncbi:hypothetical protein CPB83DRAFT_899916 [Crepidotus variabilis]|uniref:Transmembrane protein n=1 Tax=Crepidotus variabilis TaxID=179855 RepID=A0A9P6E432_9AGAR|nr:hypothetical protein CPB83DRAFT_899916 [Crepidotus variabilis]